LGRGHGVLLTSLIFRVFGAGRFGDEFECCGCAMTLKLA
jgi:hypothetical protein